ncbi:site-specific integrase [Bradyrhizobium japonicum]|uniref:DUF6538 domain-containing protein n=1 Tax=Bradyrhizobium japonicum TaxID=375 RepID=UPI001BA70006|nr:DUF6538 domain-containing protein [Bradyrhizobium japonicum]MBR0991027.1 site-specific integrase [Bradyrhizobium japonicum]
MVLSMSRPWKHPVTGVYYFRKIVPAGVRALVGKREWKISLATKDPDEARSKHAVEAVRVSQELTVLRLRLAALSAPPLPELDAETIKRVGDAYYVHLLEEDEERRVEGFRTPERIPYDPTPTFEEYVADGAELLAIDRDGHARGEVGAFYMGEVDEVLSWDGFDIRLDPASPSRKRVARELQAAAIRAAKAKEERHKGEPIATPAYPPPLQKPAPAGSLIATQPLLTLFADWWREAKATGRKASTHDNYRNTMNTFIAFLGHDDAAKVTEDDVIRFKDHRLSVVSAKTVKDGDLAALKSVLGWGKANRRLVLNAAEGITLKLGKRPQLRPKGFTADEARDLLKAADNCPQNPRERSKLYLSKRWIPWLCAYTGARVGEMIQLRKQDVRFEDGHYVATITPEAGTEKNNLARDVVLHPHLIEKGFPDLLASSQGGYLFIDPTDSARILNTLKSRRNDLAEFARETITDTRVKPNHGWRHRHTTVWLEAGLSDRVKDYIQGRPPKTVGDTYGDVTIKAQIVNLASFPQQGV